MDDLPDISDRWESCPTYLPFRSPFVRCEWCGVPIRAIHEETCGRVCIGEETIPVCCYEHGQEIEREVLRQYPAAQHAQRSPHADPHLPPLTA